MDFNENKLINQIYENDWLIEETYRQSDFHQFHFNNITTQILCLRIVINLWRKTHTLACGMKATFHLIYT